MPTLATVLSVAAFVLSITSFVVTLVLTIRRDIGAIRPVLVFTYRSGVGWHVENIGNGPALDVVFHRLHKQSVTQNVRIPTLAKASEFFIHFAKHDSKQVFVATYRDADKPTLYIDIAARRFDSDKRVRGSTTDGPSISSEMVATERE